MEKKKEKKILYKKLGRHLVCGYFYVIFMTIFVFSEIVNCSGTCSITMLAPLVMQVNNSGRLHTSWRWMA